MSADGAPPIPAGLLTTITRFAVLAGALSVAVRDFVGLTGTLSALGLVAWMVARRSPPSRTPARALGGRGEWIVGGLAAAVGWSVTLEAQGAWLVVRGPALAMMTVVVWGLARHARASGGSL